MPNHLSRLLSERRSSSSTLSSLLMSVHLSLSLREETHFGCLYLWLLFGHYPEFMTMSVGLERRSTGKSSGFAVRLSSLFTSAICSHLQTVLLL